MYMVCTMISRLHGDVFDHDVVYLLMIFSSNITRKGKNILLTSYIYYREHCVFPSSYRWSSFFDPSYNRWEPFQDSCFYDSYALSRTRPINRGRHYLAG